MKRIDQTKKMIALKKELQEVNGNKQISQKTFKRLYGFNVRKFACIDEKKEIVIQTTLKKQGASNKLTIQYGIYEILQDKEWVKITLDNIKKYATYDKTYQEYHWKKDFTARLTVQKYYYAYKDIINGLYYAIAKNILKEQKKICSLENRKLRLCEYFDSQINYLKGVVKQLQTEN